MGFLGNAEKGLLYPGNFLSRHLSNQQNTLFMKKYEFFPSLLIRTPLYSFEQYKNLDYSSILKNDEFKIALLLASKSFFSELEKKLFNYELLNDKQKHTVRKYINRASFRSIPFGLFSSFSLVNWSDELESKVVLSEPDSYIKFDFSILQRLWERFLKDRITKSTRFQTNQSFYFSGTDFRYIKTENDRNKETLFSMVSIARNAILKKVLKFCMIGKSYEEIVFFLLAVGVNKEEADAFIMELLNQQIIVSNNTPNVTGEDYSDLIFKFLDECHENDDVRELKHNINKLSSSSSTKIYQLSTIENVLDRHLLAKDEKNYFYSITERKHLSGGLTLKYQEQIKDGLYCLNLLSKVPVINDLDKFKNAFKEKYESEEVSLLEVLDSQFGIGYGEFDKIKDNYGFSNVSFRASERDYAPANDEEKDIVSLLFNEWRFKNGYSCGYELEITDNHLKNVKAKNKQDKHPPSITVMFRTMGEKLFIECAGGCSALSLIGRFSYSKQVFEFGKKIADQEQKLNKDVIFAEVAHVCNLHSANINRRHHLRGYEIPVLTNSIIEKNKQIHLSDIMVSVSDDTVVLRSKRLGKIIIPRLSSAFNYTKNSFPVFRFLCDVQNQHLKSNFSFSLASLVPGLKFYPRVRYKSCILQIAEWHLEAKELYFLQEKEPLETFELFQNFAKGIKLPRYFVYTYYDNFLVFDSQKSDDITFFLKEVRNKGVIILKEFPFIEEDSLVKDSSHRPFLAQYVASLYLNEEVYKVAKEYKNKKKQSALIKDTRDWLYFKIYCHPLSSDIILCDYLFPLIKKYIKAGNIREWFWVRYNDPEYHIRFRIKPSQNMKASIFETFNTCLNKLSLNKLVNYFLIDIYKREIERYSAELIQDVESVFSSSSNAICRFLKIKYSLNCSDEKVMIEAASSIYEILLSFGFSYSERVQLCKFQFDQFSTEFRCPMLKPEIEKLHKRLNIDIGSILNCNKNKRTYKFLKKDILNLIQKFYAKKVKRITLEKLAIDIIHMHLNRLYAYNQRHFEMVTYYLLYRNLTAQMHKNHLVYP